MKFLRSLELFYTYTCRPLFLTHCGNFVSFLEQKFEGPGGLLMD